MSVPKLLAYLYKTFQIKSICYGSFNYKYTDTIINYNVLLSSHKNIKNLEVVVNAMPICLEADTCLQLVASSCAFPNVKIHYKSFINCTNCQLKYIFALNNEPSFQMLDKNRRLF